MDMVDWEKKMKQTNAMVDLLLHTCNINKPTLCVVYRSTSSFKIINVAWNTKPDKNKNLYWEAWIYMWAHPRSILFIDLYEQF